MPPQEVRLFGLGPFLRRRMHQAQVMADARQADHDRGVLTLQILYLVLAAAVVTFAVWHAAARATNGELEVGSVVLLSGALLSLQTSIATVVEMIGELNRTAVLFSEFVALTSTEIADSQTVGIRDRGRDGAPVGIEPECAISFANVTFRYPDTARCVLQDVSFAVDVGETVALVGPNGSGKSTIVKLVAGLYLPQDGVVSCAGKPLTVRNLDTVRSLMSVVFEGLR